MMSMSSPRVLLLLAALASVSSACGDTTAAGSTGSTDDGTSTEGSTGDDGSDGETTSSDSSAQASSASASASASSGDGGLCAWQGSDPGNLVATGSEVGDTIENVSGLVDQCGVPRSLYDFAGGYRILSMTIGS
jgi:hypothetical protein